MKSAAVTFATWGILFCVLWYGAHQFFYPPADWIAALVVSFLGSLGIGGLRKARIERRDAAIVARSKGEPRDGKRVAIFGTIEPVDALLKAPFTGVPCVIYDYEISHIPPRRSSDDSQPSPVVDRGGMAMVPAFIRSGGQEVRLLAVPGIEGFEPADLPDDVARRARAYIDRTKFEEHSIVDALKLVSRMLDDKTGSFRLDSKNTDFNGLKDSHFKEHHVPPGTKVCAIGRYSAKDKAIVPQDNVGGVRLIRGEREEALHHLHAKSVGSIAIAVVLLAIPGPVAYGLLTMRENYNEEHGLPSVWKTRVEAFHQAVAAGRDFDVRKAMHRGIDVNEPNESGIPALALAPNAEVARVLLDAGADVNRPDKDGYTPLMLQARDGRVDVVKLLVSRGANRSWRGSANRMTALEIAIANGQDAVAAVLREAR